MRQLLWRLPLVTIIAFEVLAAFQIITIQPSYTSFGLILQSSAVLAMCELMNWYMLKRGAILAWWVPVSICIALGADAAGDYLGWYYAISFYDAILHFAIPMVISACLISLVYTVRRDLFSHPWFLFCIATTVTTFGALYEVEEYLEDFITGSHRLGDGFDTANDLLMDFLGASLPPIVLYTYNRLRSTASRTEQKKSSN